MKKAHYILLLFFSFINLAKSQDCIELLIKDYKTIGITQEFKTFIANDPDGLLIYQKLSGSSFVARTDADVLIFFKKLSTNNLDLFATTLLKQLTDSELKLFAKNFGNLGKVDFQKLANNSELLSVWKKYKSLNFSKVDDLLEYSKVWKQEIRNITFDDFFIKTKNQFNIAIKETGDPKFATELFEAWKKGVGNEKELQQIYRKYKLDPNIVYPPCEGVWGITLRKALEKEYFDRFQKYESLSGSYVGVVAEGESFTIASRALKENYQEIVENGADYYYFKFKFKEGYTGDLEIGEAIPWFDKIGGAQQGKIPNKLNEITDQIEIAEKWKLENGTWVKIDNALQGAGKLGLLSKLENFTNLKKWVNSLDDVADAGLISKLDNYITANPTKLQKLEGVLNAPVLKNQEWENLKSVFDAFKKAEGKGVSVGHKKFPAVDDEGSGSFVLKNAKQYQTEASGDAALSLEKASTSWDNIDDAGKLIDRKYGHGTSVFNEVDDGFGGKIISVKNQTRANSIIEQATRQVNAAGGTPIKWEISTELGAKGIKKLFDESDNILLKNIDVVFIPQIKIIP